MSNALKITPKTRILYSLCENPLTWLEALGEWIDNSLDAGATNVLIEFGPPQKGAFARHILVRDNGRGSEFLEPFVTLGDHVPQVGKRGLGRYGVGAKDAGLWIGGPTSVFRVVSVKGGKVRGLSADWSAVVASDWEIGADCIDAERDALAGEAGTTITVSPVSRKIPEGAAWPKLLDELGYVFTPAIKRGVQILVRGKARGSVAEPLAMYQSPPLEPGHVDAEIVVGGKRAHVHVGIVREDVPSNPRAGITYTHKHRVIEPASGRGCGEFSIRRIFGWVSLDSEWKLAKNKNAISRDAEELYEAVFDVCKDLLKRAETQAQTLSSAAFLRGVDDMVNQMVFGSPDAKAKRGKGNKKGTQQPTGEGSGHKRAKRDQDGSTFTRGCSGKLRVEYVDLNDEYTIGRYNMSGTVMLSETHPYVQALQRSGNQIAVAQLAANLFAEAVVLHPSDKRGQFLLAQLEDTGDLSEKIACAMGRILRDVSFDSRPMPALAPAVPALGSDSEN